MKAPCAGSPEAVKGFCKGRRKFEFTAYLSTQTVYQYKIHLFFSLLLLLLFFFGGGGEGGFGHTGKWIQENIIFMQFCFKLSKKIEKLLKEQPTHTLA